QKMREQVVPVEVVISTKRHLDWTLEQTGDIRSLQEVDVYPKVPGKIIEKIVVEKGDLVSKGELIAVLEDRTVRAQLKEAEAALRSSEANLDQVEANLVVIQKDRARLQELVQEHAISQQRMDQIDAQYKATLAGKKLAIAQIERASATLQRLKILYEDHRISAPIGGYVSTRYVDQGAMSNLKKPIIRISSKKVVKIVTTVTEQDYPIIRKGMEAEVRVDSFPDRVFKGIVTVINPTLDSSTRTGELEIHVSNGDQTLRSGMFAHIRLLLGKREAAVVSKDALNKLPGTGNYYVYVVENNEAVMKNVRIGLIQGTYAEIKAGLDVGEKVVIKGQNRLKDGMMVKVNAKVQRTGQSALGGM
ncbi:MAG: efflux RND transporter periplasmic adaptor subunit, partial [Thermodesulfobacteriota bacterium]|nr:efflux RND transporter periplasmic adaptor subunit [Thermodesulfobacteriota bacterium]